jgi:tungstate transport system permease protein
VVQLTREVRFGVMAAVIAAFGRVISEVGVAMMLGGNIRGYTRTMTTAIALETSKGDFSFGLSLGIILMSVALVINLLFNFVQQRQAS